MRTRKLSLLVLVCAGTACGAERTAVTSRPAARAALNPQIARMADNTWLRLKPAREPRSRMYSGCCIGDGNVWFFGGGHHAYKYNDVELFRIADNRWDRLTD
jgi:hypothetical protein